MVQCSSGHAFADFFVFWWSWIGYRSREKILLQIQWTCSKPSKRPGWTVYQVAPICLGHRFNEIFAASEHRLQDNENELLEQIDRMEAAWQTTWIVFWNFQKDVIFNVIYNVNEYWNYIINYEIMILSISDILSVVCRNEDQSWMRQKKSAESCPKMKKHRLPRKSTKRRLPVGNRRIWNWWRSSRPKRCRLRCCVLGDSLFLFRVSLEDRHPHLQVSFDVIENYLNKSLKTRHGCSMLS